MKTRPDELFCPFSPPNGFLAESHQAWTGFYASRNILKGVARRASAQLHAAETLFTLYRINYPDGPVAKDWALAKLKALRWAVSEVENSTMRLCYSSHKMRDMQMKFQDVPQLLQAALKKKKKIGNTEQFKVG